MRRVNVGLLGCGVVGRGLVSLVERERERVRDRFGLELNIRRILVRDLEKPRGGVDASLLTQSALDVIDGDCDVVVELIGGTHTAGTLVRRALARGRNVVTANKALLAAHGAELFAIAARSGLEIGFEASVCGGVPIVGALRRGLAGDSIEGITGILNGTCNYVLCRMEEGLDLADAVACAQERGFAEADPSLDVDGTDAAQKLAILAQLAFEAPVRRTRFRGIEDIRSADIASARRQGSVVRLVAEARRTAGGVELMVEPRRLEIRHPLARVVDEQNCVIVRGRALGDVCLSGAGAGSMPTAAAVLSDVIWSVAQSPEERAA